MPANKRFYFYLKLALFVIYFINGIIAIDRNSVVSDEGDHISYGIRVLKGQPQKVIDDDASTQPIAALNALPRAVEQLFDPGLKKTDYGISDAKHGRYITLVICVLAGIFIYLWSKGLFGEKAGLFSLFLFVFCPTINANINIVGTDAYAMLFTLTSAYYFRKFLLCSGWRNFIFFSIHTGIALVVKQSLFLLPIFFAFIAAIVVLQRKSLLQRLRLNLIRSVVFVLIVLFIINLAFLFNGTGQSLSQYYFESSTFQQMQQWAGFNKIPLPLPVPFVEGFDLVKKMLSIGSGHPEVSGKSYLFGNYFTGVVWYYYSVIILFKTPISVLLLLIAVQVIYFKNPFSKTAFFNTGFPLALGIFFIIFISLNNTSQHGVRHLLMIYPLFYVCMGQIIKWRIFRSRIIFAVVILYSLATFYFYFPNLLSYTNELIWDKKKVYKVLASSNIDHGQCGFSLKKYLMEHAATKFPGSTPQAGNFIVGINDYLDLKGNGHFVWLKNFEPYGHVNHCFLLFRITETDLLRKHLK